MNLQNNHHLMHRFLFLTVLVIILLPPAMKSQDTLTLEAAIKIALEKNYDVIIMRNNADIAELNNAAGNAGMLPTVYGQVSDNFSQSTIFQRFATGNEISSNNAIGNNFSAFV